MAEFYIPNTPLLLSHSCNLSILLCVFRSTPGSLPRTSYKHLAQVFPSCAQPPSLLFLLPQPRRPFLMHRSFLVPRPTASVRSRPLSLSLCGNSLVPCECLMGHQFRRIRRGHRHRTATERRRRTQAGAASSASPLLLAFHLSLIALALSLPKKTDAVSEPPLLNATVNGVRLAAGRQAGR